LLYAVRNLVGRWAIFFFEEILPYRLLSKPIKSREVGFPAGKSREEAGIFSLNINLDNYLTENLNFWK
jgi:hypothetical protein